MDENKGGGTYIKHGQLASPQGPCGYEVPARGAGTQNEGGINSQGTIGQYRETPNSSVEMAGRVTGNLPTQGKLPAGEQRLSTPMDASQNGTSIGATGQASGTGPTGAGKISSPWAGPFGDVAGK